MLTSRNPVGARPVPVLFFVAFLAALFAVFFDALFLVVFFVVAMIVVLTWIRQRSVPITVPLYRRDRPAFPKAENQPDAGKHIPRCLASVLRVQRLARAPIC